MTTRADSLILVLIAIALGAPGLLYAETNAAAPRLRFVDAQLRRLEQAGREHSPSFRALVDRLAATDVVVYVQCARLRSHLDGDLTFMSAVGGFRYVMVRIAWHLNETRKIAILGHELQHALEIAERPEIVDPATMARAYERFGFTRRAASSRLDFDTAAAIDTGKTVWRELALRADGD